MREQSITMLNTSRRQARLRVEMELRHPVIITGRKLIIILIEIRNLRTFHTWYLCTQSQRIIDIILQCVISFSWEFNFAHYFV